MPPHPSTNFEPKKHDQNKSKLKRTLKAFFQEKIHLKQKMGHL